jgi:hypothetical protein
MKLRGFGADNYLCIFVSVILLASLIFTGCGEDSNNDIKVVTTETVVFNDNFNDGDLLSSVIYQENFNDGYISDWTEREGDWNGAGNALESSGSDDMLDILSPEFGPVTKGRVEFDFTADASVEDYHFLGLSLIQDNSAYDNSEQEIGLLGLRGDEHFTNGWGNLPIDTTGNLGVQYRLQISWDDIQNELTYFINGNGRGSRSLPGSVSLEPGISRLRFFTSGSDPAWIGKIDSITVVDDRFWTAPVGFNIQPGSLVGDILQSQGELSIETKKFIPITSGSVTFSLELDTALAAAEHSFGVSLYQTVNGLPVEIDRYGWQLDGTLRNSVGIFSESSVNAMDYVLDIGLVPYKFKIEWDGVRDRITYYVDDIPIVEGFIISGETINEERGGIDMIKFNTDASYSWFVRIGYVQVSRLDSVSVF